MTHLHSPIKEQLDSIWMKAAVDLGFSLRSLQGKRQLQDDIVATCNVCIDTSRKVSLPGTYTTNPTL